MSSVQYASETPQKAPGTSRFNLRNIALGLIILGLLVSGYLSYVKLTEVPMACIANGPFNCSAVQNSAYSKLFGVPIAWLGFGTYILIFGLVLFEKRVQLLKDYGHLILFGVTLFAWIYSMWLVYIQFFVLEALCQWCLTHEVIITILFGVLIARLIQSMRVADIELE